MTKRPNENPVDLGGEYRALGGPLGAELAGERADGYLSRVYPFLSRAQWQKRLAEGKVLVSGRAVRPSYRVREGDAFAFWHPSQVEPEVDRDLYPIWKQGNVMAIYKPGNLPMHENGPYRFNTVAHILKQEVGPEWAAVHRLDRETSGIVLCGSTYEVRMALCEALAEREVEKEYIAIARGVPPRQSFIETGPIGDDTTSVIRIKKWVVEGGLPSETWFEVLETKGDYVLLRARPKTGRTNQIRIHAAVNGLVLVGDKLYHPDEEIFLEYFERGVTERVVQETGFKRLCLHATRLTFRHPETGETCDVRCPMPPDMQEFWNGIDSPLTPLEKRDPDDQDVDFRYGQRAALLQPRESHRPDRQALWT